MVQKFDFQELELKGAYVIRPFYATDERGGFIKDYNIDTFKNAGIDYKLKETFYTISKKNVIRAIHFQLIKPQPMRCISGHLYYVMVDLRPESPTYKKWIHFDLKGDDVASILVPAGFGQGYIALEDTIMSYKAAEVFDAQGDSGIRYDDKDLSIDWPLDEIGGKDKLIISQKDLELMSFAEYDDQLKHQYIK